MYFVKEYSRNTRHRELLKTQSLFNNENINNENINNENNIININNDEFNELFRVVDECDKWTIVNNTNNEYIKLVWKSYFAFIKQFKYL